MSQVGRCGHWAGSSRPAGQQRRPLGTLVLPDLTSPLPIEQAAQTGLVPGQQVPIPYTLSHF